MIIKYYAYYNIHVYLTDRDPDYDGRYKMWLKENKKGVKR